MEKIYQPVAHKDGCIDGHEVHLDDAGCVYLMGADRSLARVIVGGPATVVSVNSKGGLAASVPVFRTNTQSGDILVTSFYTLQAAMVNASIKVIFDGNVTRIADQIAALLPKAPDEGSFLMQIDLAQKELLLKFQIKAQVDYSISVKHGKVSAACHYIYEDTIREVFLRHGVVIEHLFPHQ